MGVISLDHAEPSMVLASPVKDKTGRLLIPAGKVLSERHIESLRMWGISTLEVEGADQREADDAPIDPELIMEAEKLMAGHFGTNDLTHPFMRALSSFCVQRKARSLEERGTSSVSTGESPHGT